MDKATAYLPAALQEDLSQAAQTFQAALLARGYSQAPLAPLLEAARAKQTLQLYYQSRSSKQLIWRQADPYEVALRNYGLLAASDAEYARFLHGTGYGPENSPKRFKLFVFLLAARAAPGGGRCAPVRARPAFLADWFAGSRLSDPLRHGAAG